MSTWPIKPLTTSDLDFAVANYDFTSFMGNEQSELPGLGDAIDSTLLDYAASITDQTTLVISLFEGLDDLVNIPGEIVASDDVGNTLADLSNAAAAGDAVLGDYAGQIGDTSGGNTGNGGGTTTPSSDCSKRTNQYGLSKTGTFSGAKPDWQLTFQVLRVQDGPCTYHAAPAASPGATQLPTITSFTLSSGDSKVWQLGKQTSKADDGTPFDEITVKVTPTQPGHFDGTALLTLGHPNTVRHVGLSVDFIP